FGHSSVNAATIVIQVERDFYVAERLQVVEYDFLPRIIIRQRECAQISPVHTILTHLDGYLLRPRSVSETLMEIQTFHIQYGLHINREMMRWRRIGRSPGGMPVCIKVAIE